MKTLKQQAEEICEYLHISFDEYFESLKQSRIQAIEDTIVLCLKNVPNQDIVALRKHVESRFCPVDIVECHRSLLVRVPTELHQKLTDRNSVV